MKYVVVIADGMADHPVESLGGLTPMAWLDKPVMDGLARAGRCGMAKTVPDGMAPGSDVANLSIFGYDPAESFSGRAPLEAASMGVAMADDDVAFRCNLVTFAADGGVTVMDDYSAGHIKTDEARPFIEFLDRNLGISGVRLFPGVSYRHLLIWNGGEWRMRTTPPHDISDKPADPHLPSGDGSEFIRRIMARSRELLSGCELNKARVADGRKEVSSVWLWGQGRRPQMTKFTDRFGLSGMVISAVDLIRGIGMLAGLPSHPVPGITGYLDTNFEGKAAGALDVLRDHDICFVHIEACDETSHEGSLDKKLDSMRALDGRFMRPLVAGLDAYENYRLLLVIDHPTPVHLKTHVAEPVPFVIYEKGCVKDGVAKYSEKDCAATGLYFDEGHELIRHFIDGGI